MHLGTHNWCAMKILAITDRIGHGYVAVLSLIFLSSQILAQKNPQLNDLTQKLESYVNNSTPEKVYLRTDRDFYRSGDTIWFKAYLVNGIMHMPSDKSKIVYVELLDPNGGLVAERSEEHTSELQSRENLVCRLL